jgi:hypothetical protein
MPKRTTSTSEGEAKFLKNCSFETQCASWFTQGGWQVFIPLLDHGHCTDLLLSDGPNYYRVQIKTIEAQNEDCEVENRWKDTHVHFVVFFAKRSNWGYIIPAFATNKKRLNNAGGVRFERNRKDFLKAWHELPNKSAPVVASPIPGKFSSRPPGPGVHPMKSAQSDAVATP